MLRYIFLQSKVRIKKSAEIREGRCHYSIYVWKLFYFDYKPQHRRISEDIASSNPQNDL